MDDWRERVDLLDITGYWTTSPASRRISVRFAIVHDQRIKLRDGRGRHTRRDRPGGDLSVASNANLPKHVEESALVAACRVGIIILHVIEPDNHIAAARDCSTPSAYNLVQIVYGPSSAQQATLSDAMTRARERPSKLRIRSSAVPSGPWFRERSML